MGNYGPMHRRLRFRSLIGSPLVVLGFFASIGSAVAQVPSLQFRPVDSFRATPVLTRPAFGDRPVEREPQTAAPATRPNSHDRSLGSPLARLTLDADALREAARIPIGNVMPSGSPLIKFDFADYAVDMALVEIVADSEFDVLHYTLVHPAMATSGSSRRR